MRKGITGMTTAGDTTSIITKSKGTGTGLTPAVTRTAAETITGMSEDTE